MAHTARANAASTTRTPPSQTRVVARHRLVPPRARAATVAPSRVWRRIDEHCTAVIDPRFDVDGADGDADGDDDGGLGPSSDDIALANYLRAESSAQREAMMRSSRREAARFVDIRAAVDRASAVDDAVYTLSRDGAVFLRGVVDGETCDGIMAVVHEACEAARAEYGDALRRTDVKLAFEGDTKACWAQACGRGGVLEILERMPDATAEAVMVEMSVLATERGADRQVLHPDASIDAEHAPLYSLFVALQDIDMDMGPTAFVLESQGRATHDAFPATKWGSEQFETLRGLRWCDATLRKGDAVLYDARTFHQGGANESRRRALMTATFLKPPIPPAPTRRNANGEWSIRNDVFNAMRTVRDIADMDKAS